MGNRGDNLRGYTFTNGEREEFSVRYGNQGRAIYFRVGDDVWLDTEADIERWGWQDALKEVEGAHA